jgi:hypothetical protein
MMKTQINDATRNIKKTGLALTASVLLAAPFAVQADNSFKGTYQFGTGSMEPRDAIEVTIADIYKDGPSGAYATPHGVSATGEKADMAAFTSKKDEPAIPGYIGVY